MSMLHSYRKVCFESQLTSFYMSAILAWYGLNKLVNLTPKLLSNTSQVWDSLKKWFWKKYIYFASNFIFFFQVVLLDLFDKLSQFRSFLWLWQIIRAFLKQLLQSWFSIRQTIKTQVVMRNLRLGTIKI